MPELPWEIREKGIERLKKEYLAQNIAKLFYVLKTARGKILFYVSKLKILIYMNATA